MPILFDLDDTLLDQRSAQEAYLQKIYDTHQAELPQGQAAFRAAWDHSADRYWARYLKGEMSMAELRRIRVREAFGNPEMPDAKVESIVEEYLGVYEASWALFPDALPLLDALRGRRLACITNGHAEQQMRKLKRTGILARFAVVAVSEAVGHAKPSPEIFQYVCRKLGCTPGECVMIGDDWQYDMVGAANFGIRPIWLTRQGPQKNSPVPNIQSLAELMERPELRRMLAAT